MRGPFGNSLVSVIVSGGAEPLSRRPWNTGARGVVLRALRAGSRGEDMPRKLLDRRFTDHPIKKGKGHAPFPASGEDGCGQSPPHGQSLGVILDPVLYERLLPRYLQNSSKVSF